jgi:uncharacterized membrane-anchored protein
MTTNTVGFVKDLYKNSKIFTICLVSLFFIGIVLLIVGIVLISEDNSNGTYCIILSALILGMYSYGYYKVIYLTNKEYKITELKRLQQLKSLEDLP